MSMMVAMLVVNTAAIGWSMTLLSAMTMNGDFLSPVYRFASAGEAYWAQFLASLPTVRLLMFSDRSPAGGGVLDTDYIRGASSLNTPQFPYASPVG